MREEVVHVHGVADPSGGDVLVRFTLPGLPPLGPEPGLVGRDGQDRLQFDVAVLVLDDLHLCTRLVEVHAPSEVSRQGDGPAGLHRDEVALHDGWQDSSDTALR